MRVQVLLLVLGGGYLEKFHILDSLLLVHYKIATISGNSFTFNKNGFLNILSSLPGIKKLPREAGMSHFRLPCVSTPQCFNVKIFPEMRGGLIQHLSPVLIPPKQLLS